MGTARLGVIAMALALIAQIASAQAEDFERIQSTGSLEAIDLLSGVGSRSEGERVRERSAAAANGLDFEGTWRFVVSFTGSYVDLAVDRIRNSRPAGSYTGSIELHLRASTARPVLGQTLPSGYLLGTVRPNTWRGVHGDQLFGGDVVSNISVRVPLQSTPARGCYYVTLVLLEYTTNQGWVYTDFSIANDRMAVAGASCGGGGGGGPGGDTSACQSSSRTACLDGGRFEVQIDWRNHSGQTGAASRVGGGTDSSSNFWFFTADNWELLLKVLDGCVFNDRFWVYFAATTDIEFTVRVRDTRTGVVKTYTNPLGHPANAVTDTNAFATCP
jgi:hypothetical protein